MFKYQLLSDIHLEKYEEFNYTDLIKPIEPVLFLAGDIGHIKHKLYKSFIDYVSNNWEIVYIVLGNHEFYIEDDKTIYTYEELYDMYENFFLEYPNIILVTEGYEYKINLNYTNGKNIYIIGGIGFPTLETNINEIGECYYNSDIYYRENFNDFNFIYKTKTKKIDVEYFNSLSRTSKSLLIESINELSKLEEEYSIILLTHFPYGIHSLTSSSKFHNDDKLRQYYFCNSIDNGINRIIINSAKLLIAGHTHYSYKFIYNDAKYVSNQLGHNRETYCNPLYIFILE
jgi:hypothetical protein